MGMIELGLRLRRGIVSTDVVTFGLGLGLGDAPAPPMTTAFTVADQGDGTFRVVSLPSPLPPPLSLADNGDGTFIRTA